MLLVLGLELVLPLDALRGLLNFSVILADLSHGFCDLQLKTSHPWDAWVAQLVKPLPFLRS